MKRVEVRLRLSPADERVVGQLAEHERRVYVEYSPGFLETGWQLSPVHLRTRPGLIEHTDHAFGPLPGLFDDSLPDGWGMLLMDRFFAKQKIAPGPIDRLRFLGTRTMGALTYHPPSEPAGEDSDAVDLGALAEGASEVLEGSASDVLPELLRLGGSPHGARPKVLVGVRGDELLHGSSDLPEGYAHWLVKFLAPGDKPDHGRVELAYARMAEAAGIDVPESRLFEVRVGRQKRAFFATRRFDRERGNVRRHAHTLGGLLQIPLNRSRDYDDLFRATRVLMPGNNAALRECFRRMVFNVAAHNRDDHVKNFAFLMGHDGAWSLSPAYDLDYARGPGGWHQMTIEGEGAAPSREHCLALGERHDVRRRDAVQIIEQVNSAVGRWKELAKGAGCPVATVRAIAREIRLL